MVDDLDTYNDDLATKMRAQHHELAEDGEREEDNGGRVCGPEEREDNKGGDSQEERESSNVEGRVEGGGEGSGWRGREGAVEEGSFFGVGASG